MDVFAKVDDPGGPGPQTAAVTDRLVSLGARAHGADQVGPIGKPAAQRVLHVHGRIIALALIAVRPRMTI